METIKFLKNLDAAIMLFFVVMALTADVILLCTVPQVTLPQVVVFGGLNVYVLWSLGPRGLRRVWRALRGSAAGEDIR